MSEKFEIPSPEKYDDWEPTPELEDKTENTVNLMDEIDKAKQEALNLAEIETTDKKEAGILNNFLIEKISLNEYLNLERRDLNPGEIEIPDEEIMMNTLVFLLQDSQLAKELLDHELEHFHKAMDLGLTETKLIIRFFKEGNQLSLRPAIKIILPKNGDEKNIRKALIKIIGAPKELSDLDQNQIQNL